MVTTGVPIEQQRLRNPVCLQCNDFRQLVGVAAAVRAGRSTGVVRGEVVGRFGYDVPVEATVTQMSDLARMLAPPARPRPAAGAAVTSAVAGLLGLFCVQAAGSGHEGAWVGAAFFLIGAFACGAAARAGQRRARAMGPVVEGALWLWRRSWYCRRCGVVSVLTPAGSTVMAAQGLAASLVALSRRSRWQAVGDSYADG